MHRAGWIKEQYEAARRRAQQLAEQNARRRTVQQPMRTAQGRHISQRPVVTEQPAPAPEPPVQGRAQQAAPAPEKPRELTYAQRQAMAPRRCRAQIRRYRSFRCSAPPHREPARRSWSSAPGRPLPQLWGAARGPAAG